MNEPLLLQGRQWPARELEEIIGWVREHGNWSRYRLSRQLCLHWSWRRPNGELADMAARSFLGKLEQRGLIELPALRRPSPNRMRHRRLEPVRLDQTPVETTLDCLGSLRLYEVSAEPARRSVWESLLATEHYLGYRSTVGENLKYLLCDERERPLAGWLFGSAAWRCRVRDQWIGWTERQRAERLHRITNNTRFLIPRWVRVHGLASWGWSRVARRLVSDWQAKYGHGIELVESFVDRSRFDGAAYRASNWIEVGLTQGRTRGDQHRRLQVSRKAVYVYPLDRKARQKLCQ